MTNKVVALTGGAGLPSHRFRVAPYVAGLRSHGYDLDVYPAPVRKDSRPAALGGQYGKLLWGAFQAATRVGGVAASRRAAITWLQRELVASQVTLEPLLGRPLVLDVDDAIWHSSDRRRTAFNKTCRLSDAIFAGNAYIAEYCSQSNRHVVVIPTAIDTDLYAYRNPQYRDRPIIGWLGTSSNYRYLIPVLMELARAQLDVSIRIVSDQPPPAVHGIDIDFKFWFEADEVSDISGFDIGIMPLGHDLWSRGKCGLKMLQYMSTGVPAIVTKSEVTEEIVGHSNSAVLVSTGEWAEAIVHLIHAESHLGPMSLRARERVETAFSTRAAAISIAGAFGELL